MSTVKFPASLVIYTALGRLYRCSKHAGERARAMEVMGYFDVCGPAQGGMTCAICESESNGQPRPHNGGTREVLPQGEVK